MPMPQRLESAPFDVYYNILSGDPDEEEMKSRAKRMGYEIRDNLLSSKDGKQFLFDKDGLKARLAASSRDMARATGGLGGGIVGGVAGAAAGGVGAIPGAAIGGTSGSMIAGSAMDIAMGRQESQSTQDLRDEVSRDMGEEAVGIVGGKILSEAVPFIKRGYVSIKNGVNSVKDRILNEKPFDELQNSKESIEELLDAISSGKVEKIDPDSDIDVLRAAERMGIELQADQYSKSPRFIEIAQALKSSTPQSTLRAEELEVIGKLRKEADDILRQAGDVDVAGVSDTLLSKWGRSTKALSKKAGELYDKVSQTKGLRLARVKPLSTSEFLKAREQEGPLMGLHLKVKNMLFKDGDKPPTYAYLDRVRKHIGQGYKGRGPFADSSTHELDEVYAVLSEDQMRAARVFGVDKELMLANKLVQAKKGVQDRMVSVFGKELNKDLGSKLEPAVAGLIRGRMGNFRSLMNKIPVGQRKQVAGTGLQYYLLGNKGHLTPAFVERYEKLAKNKTAKAELYKYLPDHVISRVEDLYSVAKGVFRSAERANTSKTARDMIYAMNTKEGFLQRLQGMAISTGMSASGVKGGGAVNALFAQNSNSFSQRAEQLLGSPKFLTMAESGFSGKNLKSAEAALAKTASYKSWLREQPEDVATFIAGQGIFKYLFEGP